MGVAEYLNVVDEPTDASEKLVASAAAPAPRDPGELLALAERLAARVTGQICRAKEPELLASVTLAITDQRLRIAFLEEVGRRLIC